MICSECQAEESAAKKKEHLGKLAAMSIEERIARIEEILYDAPWMSMISMRDVRF